MVVEPSAVEPVDPFQGGQFEVVEASPGAAVVHELGLVEPTTSRDAPSSQGLDPYSGTLNHPAPHVSARARFVVACGVVDQSVASTRGSDTSGPVSARLEAAMVSELAAVRGRTWYVRSGVPLEGTVSVAGGQEQHHEVDDRCLSRGRRALEAMIDQRRRRLCGEAVAKGYRRMPETEEELRWAEASIRSLVAEESW